MRENLIPLFNELKSFEKKILSIDVPSGWEID